MKRECALCHKREALVGVHYCRECLARQAEALRSGFGTIFDAQGRPFPAVEDYVFWSQPKEKEMKCKKCGRGIPGNTYFNGSCARCAMDAFKQAVFGGNEDFFSGASAFRADDERAESFKDNVMSLVRDGFPFAKCSMLRSVRVNNVLYIGMCIQLTMTFGVHRVPPIEITRGEWEQPLCIEDMSITRTHTVMLSSRWVTADVRRAAEFVLDQFREFASWKPTWADVPPRPDPEERVVKGEWRTEHSATQARSKEPLEVVYEPAESPSV